MLKPTEAERQDIIRAVFGDDLVLYANSSRFKAYFDHYCAIVCPASSGDAVIELDTPALGSHADILKCVGIITQDPHVSFNGFARKALGAKSTEASMKEKEHVARLAADVAFAVNCMLRSYYSENFINGMPRHIKWEEDVSFLGFIESAFRSGQQAKTPEQQRRCTEAMIAKKSLKAWKLSKRYGIKIKGTENLLEHLVLDPRTKTLKVFHQVSFLRAHLTKSKQEPLNLSFEESLKRGTLPPLLLLETLLTFHDVLFPVASVREKRSRAALEAMIQKNGFDPEARWIEFIRATPVDMNFEYWGDRLSILHDVVKRPPPANALVAWFERHTSERNALTVAIVGLFLSVLFGLLSFIVGVLQLVLAWVAYRYPPALAS
ncbi:hypothetical protein GQ53DRAFT_466617 [Thozetella sp. PMI_491]|nr:hypothetical protein GQ53DRAFT_466617 [Thozetella sp. PMI_491]